MQEKDNKSNVEYGTYDGDLKRKLHIFAKAMCMQKEFVPNANVELLYSLACTPLVAGDIVYQMFNEYQEKDLFKHEDKRHFNQAQKKFNSYMRSIWVELDDDTTLEICDIQDELQETLKTHKQTFWLSVNQAFIELEQETRTIVCDLILMRAITEVIMLIDMRFRSKYSHLLVTCMSNYNRILDSVLEKAGFSSHVNLNQIKTINDAAYILVDKIVNTKVILNSIKK